MIGTGVMAAKIAPDFRQVPNAELAVVMARTPQRARAFAADHGIARFTDDVNSILSDSRVDAVYVATPHTSHFPIASSAIHAGKAVLVEKPFTVTSGQARDLVTQAAHARVFLMEAMWMRFNPVVTEVLDALRHGAIGSVRLLHATFGLPFRREPASRVWDASLGASTVLEQGVYPISLAHLIFGPPQTVSARGRVEPDGIESEASILLTYSDEQHATMNTSLLAMHSMRANISGTLGHVEIQSPFWSSNCSTTTTLDFGVRTHRHVIQGNGYIPMLAAASEAIEAGRLECDSYPLATTLAVMDVVDEVRDQLANPRLA